MIELRIFTEKDCEFILNNFYPDMTPNDVYKMINDWNSLLYKNSYFEMFAVLSDNEIIGYVSLYEQGVNIIGAGIKILEKHRQNGYGYTAVMSALNYATQKGYTKAVAQISKYNTASLSLHRKLGFTVVNEEINRKGNEVFNLEKQI